MAACALMVGLLNDATPQFYSWIVTTQGKYLRLHESLAMGVPVESGFHRARRRNKALLRSVEKFEKSHVQKASKSWIQKYRRAKSIVICDLH